MAYLPTRQPFFGGLEATPPATGSAYASIFGGNSSNTWVTSTSWRRSLFRIAGTITKFRVKVNVDPTAAGSYSFTLFKNGSATGTLSVTISNGVLEATTSSSMSIAANDDLQIRCTVTGTPVAFTVASWCFMFEPTVNKRFIISGGTGNGTGDVITTEYQPAWGGHTWGTTLAVTKATMIPLDATIRSWRIEMTASQGATRVMKYYIYKNGVQEASSELELTSSSMEISGLSIDVVPGDYLSIVCITTGTAGGSAIFGCWGIELEADIDGESMIAGTGSSVSTTATQYWAITNSSAIAADTVEADRTMVAGVVERFTLSDLYIRLTTAPGTGNTRTFTIRKNSGAGTLSAVVSGTSLTGSDTSNADVFDDGDLISLQSTLTVTPAATGAIWGAKVTMLWTEEPITKTAEYRVVDEAAITKGSAYEIAKKLYSRESNASLPTDDADLSTIYTGAEVDQVDADDADRVALAEVSGQYAIHLYKTRHTDVTKNIAVQWNGQSSIAPSTASVVFQIYNQVTPGWETLDTESAAGADTDFTLNGTVTANADDYYDAGGWVAVRIYQLAP